MGLARAAHRTALTSSFMTTFIAGTPASAYAPTPAPRAVRAPTNEERLASVVEHLERELSRRETAERRLAQELAAAKAETEVRDQQIADICAQWERSVTQMQTARDEDVAHVTERLRYVEEVEVPSVRAQLEDAEMRCARAESAREAAEQRIAVAEEDARRVAAERDRRLAAAAADFQRALEERDRRLRELERRSASEAVEAERRRCLRTARRGAEVGPRAPTTRGTISNTSWPARRGSSGERCCTNTGWRTSRRRWLRRRPSTRTPSDESFEGDPRAKTRKERAMEGRRHPRRHPGRHLRRPECSREVPRGDGAADASPRQPPQPHQPPHPRQPQPPPLPAVASAPSPKPEPRAAPPPVPTSAHATPATERRPLYVPMESLVPPPPPPPPR